jgi:hypothetical protein
VAEPVVVEASVRARLLGIRLLTLDARAVVSPAPFVDRARNAQSIRGRFDGAHNAQPVGRRLDGARDAQPVGRRLAEAARVLGEGAASLEAVRDAPLSIPAPNGRRGGRPARRGAA